MLLIVCVGCAAARPARVQAPSQPAPRVVADDTARPALWLEPPPPTPTDLLPLPPPALRPRPLAPHADLAYWLATRPWTDACGKPHVDPLLAGYLAVWCRFVERRNVDATRDALAGLPHIDSAEIALAIRADIVDLLVEGGRGAVAAQGYLAAHKLDDAVTLDALVASYVAAGRSAEALQVVAGLNLREPVEQVGLGVRCDRLTQELALVTGPRVAEIRAELDKLSASGSCLRSWYQASCPLVGGTWSWPDPPRAQSRAQDGV